MKTEGQKLTLSKTTVKNLNPRVRSSIQAGGIGPQTIDPRLSCRGCTKPPVR